MFDVVPLKRISNIAETLKAHEGDIINVRLATDVRVTVPKVLLNLGVKLSNFNSLE